MDERIPPDLCRESVGCVLGSHDRTDCHIIRLCGAGALYPCSGHLRCSHIPRLYQGRRLNFVHARLAPVILNTLRQCHMPITVEDSSQFTTRTGRGNGLNNRYSDPHRTTCRRQQSPGSLHQVVYHRCHHRQPCSEQKHQQLDPNTRICPRRLSTLEGQPLQCGSFQPIYLNPPHCFFFNVWWSRQWHHQLRRFNEVNLDEQFHHPPPEG